MLSSSTPTWNGRPASRRAQEQLRPPARLRQVVGVGPHLVAEPHRGRCAISGSARCAAAARPRSRRGAAPRRAPEWPNLTRASTLAAGHGSPFGVATRRTHARRRPRCRRARSRGSRAASSSPRRARAGRRTAERAFRKFDQPSSPYTAERVLPYQGTGWRGLDGRVEHRHTARLRRPRARRRGRTIGPACPMHPLALPRRRRLRSRRVSRQSERPRTVRPAVAAPPLERCAVELRHRTRPRVITLDQSSAYASSLSSTGG